MFLPDQVSQAVSQNTSLVTGVLGCQCRICIGMSFLRDEHRVDVITGVSLETLSNGLIAPTVMASTMPMSVVFAILAYLRLPFMIHLGFWTNIHEYPYGLVFDQLLKKTRELSSSIHMCFEKLSRLRRPQENEFESRFRRNMPLETIVQEAKDFYDAFEQARSQFHPVYISTDMGALADNAVFPYEKFKRMDRGGQGSIYYVKVAQGMDRTISESNNRSHVILRSHPFCIHICDFPIHIS